MSRFAGRGGTKPDSLTEPDSLTGPNLADDLKPNTSYSLANTDS